MADRICEALGKQLFVWSGWTFTVGGAVGSFVLGQAYAWIGWLLVATGLLAVTAHLFALHRRVEELATENQRLREENREAERRLAEVPLAILHQLAGLVSVGVTATLVESLAEQLALVARFREYQRLSTRPLALRTFSKQGGVLFAVAKASSAAQAATLEVGDIFKLLQTGAAGIATVCAWLRVHQAPDKNKVVFKIYELVSGEMSAIDQLAESKDVDVIKGYHIEPAIDVSGYPEFEPDHLAEVIRCIIRDYPLGGRGST